MTKSRLFGLVLSTGLAFAGPAFAADATVAYLGLVNDPRYHPEIAYTRIEIAPALKPVEGARLGIEDLKVVTDAVGMTVTLDEQMATDAADAIAEPSDTAAPGRGRSHGVSGW